MTQAQALAARLREVLLSGTWIANTNFKDQLARVDWVQATTPIGDLNTIALLTFHINYYLQGLIQVFQGGPLDIRDKYSFDLPEIQSENDWNALVETFLDNAERFAKHVEQMDDAQLDSAFVDEKYGNYQRNIEGVIEHSYYHLGQISLIRKMVVSAQFPVDRST
ncbi:MAG: DinB family protein [Saprospiraceae bacterium]|nr:DinB family protein [Saprospiraceae bacterium]